MPVQQNTRLEFFFFLWRCEPTWAVAPSFLKFLDHAQRRITVGRAPLDEWSALAETSTWQHTTLTTDKPPCPRWDSNPTISAAERPHTYALDSAATGNSGYHYTRTLGLCNPLFCHIYYVNWQATHLTLSCWLPIYIIINYWLLFLYHKI